MRSVSKISYNLGGRLLTKLAIVVRWVPRDKKRDNYVQLQALARKRKGIDYSNCCNEKDGYCCLGALAQRDRRYVSAQKRREISLSTKETGDKGRQSELTCLSRVDKVSVPANEELSYLVAH